MVNFQGNFLFGPFAANYKLDDKFCSELLKRANKLKQATANNKLAGIISDQRIYTREDKEYFVKNFQLIFEDYMKRAFAFNGVNHDNKIHPSSFSLISLWVNFMKETEYNPIHTHSGQLSWVIYLKVPDLTKEYESFKGTGTGPGVLNLHYGESVDWAVHTLRYEPVENCMWIFPAQLRHQVAPFYTKGKRISVSGNLYLNAPNTPSIVLKEENEIR